MPKFSPAEKYLWCTHVRTAYLLKRFRNCFTKTIDDLTNFADRRAGHQNEELISCRPGQFVDVANARSKSPGKREKQLFPGGMTKEKFTYQLSDHLPLWIQINTATEGLKLEQIIRG